jgi:hypothetical protein
LPTPAPPNIAALRQRRQQVDYLDAGRKDFGRTALCGERRRGSVNWATRHVGSRWFALIGNRTSKVEQPPEHCLTNRHIEWSARCVGDDAATQPCGRLQRNRANRRLVQMRLHLGDYRGTLVWRDDQSIINWRQCRAIKGNVQHRASHGSHPTVYHCGLFHRAPDDPISVWWWTYRPVARNLGLTAVPRFDPD